MAEQSIGSAGTERFHDENRSEDGHDNDDHDVSAFDREVLEDEAEQERLLLDSRTNGKHKGKGKGKRKSTQDDGEYEMQERRSIGSQDSDSSNDHTRSLVRTRRSKRRKGTVCAILSFAIAALFALFTFGAYKASMRSIRPDTKLLSNGTSLFAPTTLLISLDGFRADFLTRGITPTLNQFISEGVSPKYMLPSFPSVTFPNHFTLVTGLHPESHGVVGNTFWDPELQEEFYYTDKSRSMQPKWWAQGEPIWVTAEKQGVLTGIHMWPGSEAGMAYSATYLDKYNGSEVLSRKTSRIMELLDLPGADETASRKTRPQLIAAYVPVVDQDGHKYGPNSTEIWDTISSVDAMLHDIFAGLRARNLTSIVNVVVVSDHGMATTSTDRLIQLDDLIDLDKIAHTDGWPLYGLRPKDPSHLAELHEQLLFHAAQSNGTFDVYLRDKDMPERFHFSANPRIAPLWMIPQAGWAIVQRSEFDIAAAQASGEVYTPRGLHGYDQEHPLMRAIFVARGPAFPHKPNSRLSMFQNTEVYNIVCDSIGIEPKVNNGTLRLPLRPVGLHSDPDEGEAESEAEDFKADDGPAEQTQTEEEKEGLKGFWAYMKDKMSQAMRWGSSLLHGTGSGEADEGEGEDESSDPEEFDQGDAPR